jgi:glycogen operon protein
MTVEVWRRDQARALAVFFAGDGLTDVDARGRPLRDDSFVLLFNPSRETVSFHVPAALQRGPTEVLVDTSREDEPWIDQPLAADAPLVLAGPALALIRIRDRMAR